MFAIEVNLLTGRYVATSFNSYDEPEWPPHPARLFSAMVAEWATAPAPDAAERAALEWLEGLPAPAVTASDAEPRSVSTHYVPVNDVAIVSLSRVEDRYAKAAAVRTELDDLQPVDAASQKKVDRLLGQLEKHLDVKTWVASAGKTNPKEATGLLPEHAGGTRTKKARHYPSMTPSDSRVTFAWSVDVPAEHEAALDGLLERVTRLGHSSSLASCRVSREVPEPTLIPVSPGETGRATDEPLRWVRPGQLADLERRYGRHEGVRPRNLPKVTVSYRRTQEPADDAATLTPTTAGEEMLVFEFDAATRKRLPATRVVEMCRALRSALMSHADDPIPEGLSGHRADGQPSLLPHVAVAGLPDVGHRHARQYLLGMAVILPAGLPDDARRATLRAIGKWEREERARPDADVRRADKPRLPLRTDGGKEYWMRRRTGLISLVGLRQSTWSRSARLWLSATPVALPTNPGRLGSGTAHARARAWARAEETVVAACAHVGLPEPASVEISLDPFLHGARRARDFPTFKQGDNVRRLVHAELIFDQPVVGPFVLGSGRYLGLGLMRPMPEPSPDETPPEDERAADERAADSSAASASERSDG